MTTDRRTWFNNAPKLWPSSARLRCKERGLFPTWAATSGSVARPDGNDRQMILITLSETGADSGVSSTRLSNRLAWSAIVSFAHDHLLSIDSRVQEKPLNAHWNSTGRPKNRL